MDRIPADDESGNDTHHELHDHPDLESDLYRATLYIWLLTRKTDPDAK